MKKKTSFISRNHDDNSDTDAANDSPTTRWETWAGKFIFEEKKLNNNTAIVYYPERVEKLTFVCTFSWVICTTKYNC